MAVSTQSADSPEALAARLDALEELWALQVAEATGRDPWHPEGHQLLPAGVPGVDWLAWLLMAGRGAGKTDACAAYFDRYMREHPGHRGGIVAPTLGDAIGACVNGPSGLRAHNPTVRLTSSEGGSHVIWPNGSTAKLFGAYTKEDIERLRAGGNRHIDWYEELAAWRYITEALEQAEMGLRLGDRPHAIASTTPKPRAGFRDFVRDERTTVTTATMWDNPHNPRSWVERMERKYKGTRIGRQELQAELIDDVEGALWTLKMVETCRVTEAPDLVRVAVAVDPSGGDEDGNDEQGILVVGKGVDGEGYVLADRSCKLTPGGWGKRSIRAWQHFDADVIVGEQNFGGDLVKANVLQAAKAMGVAGVRYEPVHASRGKQQRAEPAAALYEQGRVHHVGVFERLEYQMTQWTRESGWSPDRLDALVWALTFLFDLGSAETSWRPL